MPIEASQLRVSVEEEENWRRTLEVTVPASVVSEERDKLVQRLAGRLKLPGFRSGRIPASVVEKRYGPALNREMLDQVIGEAYREALTLEALKPISEGEVQEVEYEPDEDLTFAISFDVRPEFEVGRLGGFVLQQPPTEVGESEVDKVLEQLQEQNATFVPVEDEEGSPETGDQVSLAVWRLEDGEPRGEPQEYDLVLGSGDAIPDVESAIYTLSPGESGDFTVTFPDDFPDPDRRGADQHLRIELRGRKLQELPELDDEFARSVGDFEELETLRARIREDLEAEAAQQAEGAVRRQIMDQLLEANPFQVPETMVERYLENVLGDTEGADPEQVEQARAQIRPEAQKAVKRILLLERIAETQDLRATEDEMDDRIEAVAEKNDVSPSQVYARFQKSGRLEALEREITEGKVFEFLKEQSEIVPAEA
jgi:trigger factor